MPPSDVPGEQAWPTQPFPTLPPPLVDQHLTEDDLWDRTPEHLAACRSRLSELRNEGPFTPPSREGTLVFPGNAGGANWSGGSFDPERGRLFVPVVRWPHIVKLKRVWGAESNFDKRGGRPMRSYLRALWFRAASIDCGKSITTGPCAPINTLNSERSP